jgi:hypothetical protein
MDSRTDMAGQLLKQGISGLNSGRNLLGVDKPLTLQTDDKDTPNDKEYLQLEDFDHQLDNQFLTGFFLPYLKDLYKDLLMRSSDPQNIDKVTFTEYANLPGIINDRLH